MDAKNPKLRQAAKERFDLIDPVLTKHKGDVDAAASELGESEGRLADKIVHNKALRDKWVIGGPLSANEAMVERARNYMKNQEEHTSSRKAMIAAKHYERISTDEVGEVLDLEDIVFEKALKGIGFNDAALQHLIGIQKIARNNFKSTIELMHGGLSASYCHVIAEQNQVRQVWLDTIQELSDKEEYPIGSAKRSALLAEATEVSKMLRGVGAEMIDIATVVQRSTLLTAMLKQHKAHKPRFSS